MNQKNKIIFLSSVIIGVLTLTLGVTFAIFNFNKTSTNSKLIVGDIYMHYNETNQITIENAMPSDNYDNTNYFEFTVDGKNTTTDKDIWYDIVLSHGDDYTTRTTRIKDNLLNFRLVEVVDSVETVLIENNSYNDLTSKRIWVDTISKDTTNEVTHTYRLYMWIDKNTKIGNVNQDYTMEEWNDVYASIKVNVTGDFNVKNVSVTDESCFSYQEIEGGIEINDYDQSCGTDVIIPDTINGMDVISISDGFRNAILHTIIFPKNLETIGFLSFMGAKITNMTLANNLKTIEPYAFFFSNLTHIEIPNSVTTIGEYAFHGNRLTSLTIPNNVISIGNGAFNCNLLPDSQAYIYERKDDNNDGIAEIDNSTVISYGGKNKTIIIPENILTISASSFYHTELISVTIPDNVIEIGKEAFDGNKLTSVTIGSGIQYIGRDVFSKDSSSNPNLSSITINRSCSEIKNILASSTSSIKYYPWLTWSSPYTASGVTIYGTGSEVCDSY